MNIALVADTHLGHGAAAYADNWSAVCRWLRATAPALTVHLGDITANGAHHAAELHAVRASFDALGAIRFLPGNHDIGDNPPAADVPASEPLDAHRLADFRRVYGPDYWSLDAAGWQLLGLNAMLFGTDTVDEHAQFAWIDDQLRDRDRPLGLMLHKPLFRDGRGDREAHERYLPVDARERLLALCAGRDLRFVVSGHAHQQRRFHADGVEHVWLPSTAFCIPDALQERIGDKVVGAMLLTLTADGHRFEPVTPDGLVRHNVLDHPQVYPVVEPLRRRLGPRGAL